MQRGRGAGVTEHPQSGVGATPQGEIQFWITTLGQVCQRGGLQSYTQAWGVGAGVGTQGTTIGGRHGEQGTSGQKLMGSQQGVGYSLQQLSQVMINYFLYYIERIKFFSIFFQKK